VPVRPSHQLADYLYAQRLLAEHQARTGQTVQPASPPPVTDELYAEGRQEIFSKSKVHILEIKINPLKLVQGVLPYIKQARLVGRSASAATEA